MLLPFTEGLMRTSVADEEMAALFDRHYSRTTTGGKRFVGPSRSLILRDAIGSILFAWVYPYDGMRRDKQCGFNCAIFRNESRRLSSDIILEAERLAVEKWGPNRAYTYVDPRQVKSANPGYCFKIAGWRQIGQSKSGKILLEKTLNSGSHES